MALGGAEQRDGSTGQQPVVPGETFRMVRWIQKGTPSGVFEARGEWVVFGNDRPPRLVQGSYSSVGNRGFQIDSERPLTTPRRV